MKHTVKLSAGHAVHVQQDGNGFVTLSTGAHNAPISLTPDQASILALGLDMSATEASATVAQLRARRRVEHAAAVAAGVAA